MLALVLFAFLGVMASYGQPPQIKTKIDFPFTVAATALPAGTYVFARDDAASVFRVSDEVKNTAQSPGRDSPGHGPA